MSDTPETPQTPTPETEAPAPAPIHVGVGGPIASQVPWLDKSSGVSGVFRGIRSLLGGMKITVGYFARPSTVVTQHYPENRETLKLPERYRAQLAFNHDDNGYHKCTLCRICEEQCPNSSIIISGREKPAISKKEVDSFVWRLDSCTFCNTCVMVCPFNVLRFDGKFESSVYDRRLMQFTLNHYAGPPAGVLEKVEDPEARKAAMEPRDPFSGPSVLAELLAKQRAAKAAARAAANPVAAPNPAAAASEEPDAG